MYNLTKNKRIPISRRNGNVDQYNRNRYSYFHVIFPSRFYTTLPRIKYCCAKIPKHISVVRIVNTLKSKNQDAIILAKIVANRFAYFLW